MLCRSGRAIRCAGHFGHEFADAVGEAQAETREVPRPTLAHVPGLLGGCGSLPADRELKRRLWGDSVLQKQC